ncbi:MAG: response regulator [Candidatus Latescibacteria bacterium]|nr:response regulator [Candidatus Latescibacterota bacterium]
MSRRHALFYLLSLLFLAPNAQGIEPTLVRLAFWVPPERLEEFAAVYQEQVLPLLLDRGLVPFEQAGRPTVEGVFSRLFHFPDPATWVETIEPLKNDPEIQALTLRLGAEFGIKERNGSIKASLTLYSAPAGPGRQQPAGPGHTIPAGQPRSVWRTYDVTDGLAGPMVQAIHQDRAGYLWVATANNGVSRFDGNGWITFTTDDGLLANKLCAIAETNDGNLWVGGHGGVSRFDGKRWTSFSTDDGLASKSISTILADRQGQLWVATADNGISRFDGKEWTSFSTDDGLVSNLVYALYEDNNGALWMGGYNGASRFDGQGWTSFTTDDGLASKAISAVLNDRQDRLWVASFDQGVQRFDGESFIALGPTDTLATKHVNVLFEDRDGALWMGTRSGVSRFDGRGWTTFTTADGLVHGEVQTIHQDRDGHFWFGTAGGVSRYSGEVFTTFTQDNGLAGNVVSSLLEDKAGALWFIDGHPGTQEAFLTTYDGSHFTTYTNQDGLPQFAGYQLYQDRQDALWIGSWRDGVSRFHNGTFTSFTRADGLAADHVMAIQQDHDGDLWFSTWEHGVTRYDGTTFTTYTAADGLAGDEIVVILVDRDGSLWFGSKEMGVSRYDGQTFTTYTTDDGLAHNDILAIHQDQDGYLWFATHGGLCRYDGTTFTTYTTRNGLASNDVHSVIQDKNGHLWIGTDGGGVSRFDGQVFQNLTRQDGLPDNMALSVLQDSHGALWFSSNGGATRFQPPIPEPPSVTIKAVVADQRYVDVDEVAIPSSIDLIAFEFAATSLKTRPGQMVYRYRLQGHEEAWRQTRTNRVEYSGLPRGEYIFAVEAIDRDLNYSPNPAQLAVRLHIPYTQLAWGFLLGGACLLIVWLGIRLGRYARRLSRTNLDLASARDAAEAASLAKSQFLANMSHEIRTPMNAILGYAQILRRTPDLGKDQQQAVATIENSGQHLLTLIDEVLDLSKIEAGRMSLQHTDFDLTHLLDGLAAMFEERCRDRHLAWCLERPASQLLPVHGDRAKLTQILVNLLGNAIKFTEQGTVSLQVTNSGPQRYAFAVTDTGPGIDQADQADLFTPFEQGAAGQRQGGTGLGLAIARRQVELMGGQLAVETAPESGTRFVFTLSLPSAQAALSPQPETQLAPVERLAPGQSVHALIADDVGENRQVLEQILCGLGIQVTTANDGAQVLQQLAATTPDILFMDIRMPVLDGIETVRRIRAQETWRGLPVVAISASVLTHEQQQVTAAGFDDFIAKPFRIERLCSCLQQLLQVEFVYRDTSSAPAPESWEDLTLPADLLAALQRAVQLKNITTIEHHLKEMEQLGDAPGRLATHLRTLKQRFDMESILSTLKTVQHA